MQRIPLNAATRIEKGKEFCKKERKSGNVPAIIYGKEFEPLMIKVGERDLKKLLSTESGRNIIVDIKIPSDAGEEEYTAMIKEIQRDIYQTHFIHVDFRKISLTEPVEATIPLHLIGTAKGVSDGGMLDILIRDMSVKGLPLDIPNRVEYDVSSMLMEESLHLRDIPIPQNVEFMRSPDDLVAIVHPPRTLETAATIEAEGEAVGAAAGEAAAAPAS